MSLAVGVGCRSGCEADAIVDLVRRALEEAARPGAPAGLFTHAAKMGEKGLMEAAATLGLPLVFLPIELLRQTSGRAATRSPKVEALFDLPSIAETAALAGAGAGARLILPRRNGAGASCALAES